MQCLLSSSHLSLWIRMVIEETHCIDALQSILLPIAAYKSHPSCLSLLRKIRIWIPIQGLYISSDITNTSTAAALVQAYLCQTKDIAKALA